MNEYINNIDFYIEQYDIESHIYKLGLKYKQRGWLEKYEFMEICLWKSRRPKNLYLSNTSEDIKRITLEAFAAQDEVLKMNSLLKLNGVQIPTASAILSVVDPEHYPIIDKRCILALNHLNQIKWENITIRTWLNYIDIMRELAKKTNKTCREVEKGLFAFNRMKLDKEYKNLYL